MFYTHAQKQTNTTLSLVLPCHTWGSYASLWPISLWCCFQRLSHKNNCCYLSILSPIISFLSLTEDNTTLNTAFLFHIMTLLLLSVYLSSDAQTLWPPHHWSFERVSSWWWGLFRPCRCSSPAGSRPSSCPCPLALGAGWQSCRWCDPHGQSSSPLRRCAAHRPLDRARYLEYLEKWHEDIRDLKLKFKYVYPTQS